MQFEQQSCKKNGPQTVNMGTPLWETNYLLVFEAVYLTHYN